jgi:hypothetical protein
MAFRVRRGPHGKPCGSGETSSPVSMGAEVDEIRFSDVRAARRVLDMKGRVAAGILGMSYNELRKGERADSPVPAQCAKSAEGILQLAERVRRSPGPGRREAANPRLRVLLPFKRPRCLDCRCPLWIAVTAYSVRRGEHWYFKCGKCGRRYWSNDGRANPVNSKGGNWRALKNRVRCEDCGVECSKKSGYYWECPRCRKRYRNLKGRVQPTIRGFHVVRHLPFLHTRNCPNCGKPRLQIRARPHPPKVRCYYFECSACRKRYKFDKKIGRLVLLQTRRRSSRGFSAEEGALLNRLRQGTES